MFLKTPPLRVYPNPWCTGLDEDGFPIGRCPMEPDPRAPTGTAFVGCEIDAVLTIIHPNAKVSHQFAATVDIGGVLHFPRQTTVMSYGGVSAEDPDLAAKLLAQPATELPPTRHYLDAIAATVNGFGAALVPADEATAGAARVQFVKPADALAASQKFAESAFASRHVGTGMLAQARKARIEWRATSARPTPELSPIKPAKGDSK